MADRTSNVEKTVKLDNYAIMMPAAGLFLNHLAILGVG
jgi:hypothetical protein